MLVDLKLALPVTHNFTKLLLSATALAPSSCRNSLDDVLLRLHHLEISICDAGGEFRQRYFSNQETETHQEYPNVQYAHELLNIVQKAENLRTLEIRCTHICDMGSITPWNTPDPRNLCLGSLKVSFATLNRLIDQNKKHIRALEFRQVELKSGTWQALLLKLCTLPKLDYFHVESSGYARGLESGCYAPGLWPEPDDSEDIESYRFEDKCALGHLQRRIIENRRAFRLPAFVEHDLQRSTLPPLESLTLNADASDA